MKGIIVPLIVCISLVFCLDTSAQEKIQSKVHTGVTLETLPEKVKELNKNNEEIISILTEEENADPKLKKYTLVTAVRQLTVKDYDIISASYRSNLAQSVNWAIADGWTPVGGVFVYDKNFYQAVCKYK